MTKLSDQWEFEQRYNAIKKDLDLHYGKSDIDDPTLEQNIDEALTDLERRYMELLSLKYKTLADNEHSGSGLVPPVSDLRFDLQQCSNLYRIVSTFDKVKSSFDNALALIHQLQHTMRGLESAMQDASFELERVQRYPDLETILKHAYLDYELLYQRGAY